MDNRELDNWGRRDCSVRCAAHASRPAGLNGVGTTIGTETVPKRPDKRDGGTADRMDGMAQDDGLQGRHLPPEL